MPQLTWGEFKKQVEARGVEDKDLIAWIDNDGYEDVEVERWENGEVAIK